MAGSAINQDGRSTGLTAPNVLSQQALLREALRRASITADQVSYVECHGTGTALGDPIEIDAVRAALNGSGSPDNPLWLGAVKTNIGHLEAAAGVAGVIKVILALRHGRLPPVAHLRHINPRLSLAGSRLRPLLESVAWSAEAKPRFAGVSAFGMSGTNAHVILTDPPPAEIAKSRPEDEVHRHLPLLLSGRSAAALTEQFTRLQQWCEQHDDVRVVDVAYTLATARTAFERRATVVVERLADLPATAVVVKTAQPRPKLAMLFTGQGAQRSNMGRELWAAYPVFRAAFDDVCAEFEPHLGQSLRELIFSDSPTIDQTMYTQPALFAFEVALFRLFESWGVVAELLLGHSIGELVAAHVAGVFSLADACKLVAARGQLMQALPEGGAMVSIQASEQEVRAQLDVHDGVDIAGINGPTSTVISGERGPVEAIAAHFRAIGRKVQALVVSHAFHSRRMEPMLAPFRKVAESIHYAPPSIPLVSNVTGTLASADQLCSPEYWVEHIRAAVRFADGVRALEDGGVTAMFEIGPHGVLSAMASGCLSEAGQADVAIIASVRRDRAETEGVVRALAGLHDHGVAIGWNAFFQPLEPTRVELPTYAFQRERHWLIPQKRRSQAESGARYALAGRRVDLPTGHCHVLAIGPGAQPYLRDHAIYGRVVIPGAFYVATFLAVAESHWPNQAIEIADVDFLRAIAFDASDDAITATIALTPAERGVGYRAEFWTQQAGTWQLNAAARLAPAPTMMMTHERPFVHARFEDSVAERSSMMRTVQVEWGEAWWVLRRTARVDDRSVVGEFELHESSRGESPLTPREIDNAFGLLGLVSQGPDDGVPRLPIAIRRMVWAGRHESAGSVETGARGSDDLHFDLRFWSEDGRELAMIEDFSVRRAPITRFLREARDLYVVRWQALDLGEASTPDWIAVGAQALGGERHFVDMAGLLAALDEGTAAPACVVFVVGNDEEWIPEGLAASTWRVFAGLRDCLADPRLANAELVVVGQRIQADPEGAGDLGHAPVVGLVRSIRAESPDRRIRLVDVDTWANAERALATTAEPELIWRGESAFVPRLVPASTAEGVLPKFDGEGTVLISGGTGALGARMASHLVRSHGVRRLLLLSRRGLASPGAAELAAELEQLGANLQIEAVDITDRRALERVLGSMSHPLQAVIHTAGVLDDATIASLTPEHFERVFAAKVQGAIHLHELTKDLDLRAFVLFSSFAGLVGAAGQTNYAAANSFLDALAALRRRQQLPGLSLAWGAWAETGMASRLPEAVLARLRNQGMGSFSVDEGMAMFDAALGQTDAVLAPVRLLPSDAMEALALLRELPRAVAKPTASKDSTAFEDRVRGRTGPARERAIDELVRDEVAAVLGVAKPAQIEPDKPLQDVGLDSLMAVELRNRLQAATGLRLASTVVFDHPTPSALMRLLQAELPDDLGLPSEGEPAPASTPTGDSAGEMLDMMNAAGRARPTGQGSGGGLVRMLRDAMVAGAIDVANQTISVLTQLRRTDTNSRAALTKPILLASGARTSDPMFYCVPSPAVPSSPLQYVRLASDVDRRATVWAVANPGFGVAERLVESREAITRHHEMALRSCVTPGRAIVVGYSAGGWLAADLVSHLEQSGEPAAGLVLLDTVNPGGGGLSSAHSEFVVRLMESFLDGNTGYHEEEIIAQLTATAATLDLYVPQWRMPSIAVTPTLFIHSKAGIPSPSREPLRSTPREDFAAQIARLEIADVDVDHFEMISGDVGQAVSIIFDWFAKVSRP